jgi:hypothetical protein
MAGEGMAGREAGVAGPYHHDWNVRHLLRAIS